MFIDPIDDYNYRDKMQFKWESNRPKCVECKNPIQDEYGYHIGYDWYCEKCMEGFKEWIDEYV